MNRPNQHNRPPSKRVLLPHWVAFLLTPVVFVLGHVALPRQLSLLSARHGWADARPGRLNLLHFVGARGSFEMEQTQHYLVVRGPYQVTRNPMYLSGMLIWLGWIIFYGGLAVGAFAVAFWGSVASLVVPWEERHLETRFGEAYLRYKNSVPRWLGKRSR